MKKINNNYHGFLALPRHSKLLAHDLGCPLFGFYICLVMETVWHRGNPDIGRVIKSQADLALIIGCDQSTVSRYLATLENKGYLKRKDGEILLSHFPLFLLDVERKIHSKDYANIQELYVDIQDTNAKLQSNYAIRHREQDQNAPQSFSVPYKGNYSYSNNEDIDVDEIDRGIQQMEREGKL